MEEHLKEQISQASFLSKSAGKLMSIRKDLLYSTFKDVLPLCFNLLTQRIENDGNAIDGNFFSPCTSR